MSGPLSPQLGQINIVVENMQTSMKFYRLLGLKIDDSHPFSEHHISVRMENGFLLEFDSLDFVKQWNQGCSVVSAPGRNVIGFDFESREAVDELYARLTEAGYASQQAPFDAFWGARYAIVEDPDKNPIGLMSPLDPERRGSPP